MNEPVWQAEKYKIDTAGTVQSLAFHKAVLRTEREIFVRSHQPRVEVKPEQGIRSPSEMGTWKTPAFRMNKQETPKSETEKKELEKWNQVASWKKRKI